MNKLWIVFAVLVAFVAGCGQGYVKRTEQFSERVKSVVNPDELQAWATNLIANTPITDRKTPVYLKEVDIPKYIRAIYNEYPEDVEVVGSDAGTYVVVCYGSGNGHWGLYVGSPTLHQESDANFYVVPWKPGIYFWSGP